MCHIYLCNFFLCFVPHAALYNLVNKTNLVHNLLLVYLFLVYLSISTCFRRPGAHHQEKQLCLCVTWYLLFCVDDCLVCRVRGSHPHRITSTECHTNTVVPSDDGHIVAQNKYRSINILRVNCAPSWFYLQVC